MPTISQLARNKAADLRDVFGYIDNVGNTAYAFGPNEANGDNPGWGSTGAGLSWASQANQPEGGSNAPSVLFQPRAPFNDAVRLVPQSSSGEGSGGYRFEVDGSKLPRTRFGDVTRTAGVDGSTTMFNPSLAYDDPHYGRITDARNVDARSWSDYVGPALVAAAMAGVGALGAPAWATQLINLTRTLDNGGDGMSQILGLIAGQLGVPSSVTTLGQLALNATRRP